MIRRLVSFATALALLLTGTLGHAASHATEPFVACRPGATVYFVNGVHKLSYEEVSASADVLASTLVHYGVRCVADVSALYNPSDGLLIDVLGEYAQQKAAERAADFGEMLLEAGLALSGVPPSRLAQDDVTQLKAQVSTWIARFDLNRSYTMVDGKVVTTAQLVGRFRDQVIGELGNGTKTVLVAHSQGNLFANEVYTEVVATAPATTSRGLSVVNIANPGGKAPSGLYLTARQDLVIAPIIGALSANIDATGAYANDLLGHGFTEVYLQRDLPTGTTDANSVAGHVATLVQLAINLASTPNAIVLGSTSSRLFQIDLNAFTATVLGAFGYAGGGSDTVWDIARHPRSGVFYAITPSALYTLDPATRVLTRLPGGTVGGNALTFSQDGVLYGMGGGNVYRFDTASGAATRLPISLQGFSSSGDLAFDGDGNLWGTLNGSGSDQLVRLDLAKNAMTIVGPIGASSVYGLVFSSGMLYGVSSGGALLSIDRANGHGTVARQMAVTDITGLQ